MWWVSRTFRERVVEKLMPHPHALATGYLVTLMTALVTRRLFTQPGTGFPSEAEEGTVAVATLHTVKQLQATAVQNSQILHTIQAAQGSLDAPLGKMSVIEEMLQAEERYTIPPTGSVGPSAVTEAAQQ